MLARAQRILAGIELFALVIWIGGLFFLVVYARPGIARALPEQNELHWPVVYALYNHFGNLEIILATVVLVSNFLKIVVFRGISDMHRFALLIAAAMLASTIMCASVVRPRIADKTDSLKALPPAERLTSPDAKLLTELRRNYEGFMIGNLALGLFMVYAYRTFEERKLQAIARILKNPL